MNKETREFVYWLMDNCELAEDSSLWRYESEEYSVDGIFEVYKATVKHRDLLNK